MECSRNKNKLKCTCSYTPCSRKGVCCECVEFHRSMGEIPGCFFAPESERSYDRSIENFIRSCRK